MVGPAEVLERTAKSRPDQPMLECVGEDGGVIRRSYAEVASRAGRIAAGLARRGIGEEDRVLRVLENTATFVGCWFGVVRSEVGWDRRD